MKAVGIICEYNPFHNGHIHHMKKTKALCDHDVLVAVMSGHFVQRGEPAIISKWERTKVALSYGVDLLIELPFPYACQSATYFAKGAIDCLALAGVKDIVFGSECNDIDHLRLLAFSDHAISNPLKKGGISTVKAYEKMHGTLSPNDILGVCYIRACRPHGITAHCIQRDGAYHSMGMDQRFPSATALRHALFQGEDISLHTPMKLTRSTWHSIADYYPYLQGLLLTLSPQYLHDLFLMDEGIEHLFYELAQRYDHWEDFLHAATSKRYSASRIRRTMIHLLLQTTKQQINTLPSLSHIRVLGFNDVGRAYLKELKKKADLHIATSFADIPSPYQEMEWKAAQMYGWMHQRKEVLNQELQPPIIL